MKFKDLRQADEFYSDSIDNRLIVVLYSLDGYSRTELGVELYINDILRTRSEQIDIYQKRGVDISDIPHSVHEYGRGADLRYWIYDEEQAEELCGWCNEKFIYNGAHDTCIIHQVGDGVTHMHIQVDISNELIIRT